MGRASRSGSTPVRDHSPHSSGVPWRATSEARITFITAARTATRAGKALQPRDWPIMAQPFRRGARAREDRLRRNVQWRGRRAGKQKEPAGRTR